MSDDEEKIWDKDVENMDVMAELEKIVDTNNIIWKYLSSYESRWRDTVYNNDLYKKRFKERRLKKNKVI